MPTPPSFFNRFRALWNYLFFATPLPREAFAEPATPEPAADQGAALLDTLEDTQDGADDIFSSNASDYFRLYDVLITLVHREQHARLNVCIGDSEAMMVVLSGRVVTALYQSSLGEDAVLHIFKDYELAESASFAVVKVDPLDYPVTAHTVQLATDTLLFRVATALDEVRKSMVSATLSKTATLMPLWQTAP